MATDGDTPNWSELVTDIWSLVFKHLSFTDFARAKTVCSSWYFASKSSSPRKNHTPWLILYEDTHWLMFNSEEEKFYRTQNLGRFAECRGVASCGSWVLVFDKEINFYIINPFTPELIRLPPLEYSNSGTKFERPGNYIFHLLFDDFRINSVVVGNSVLWVDEKTKDYLVVWSYKEACHPGAYIYYCRKREQEWFEIPASTCGKLFGCLDMAYKDEKLYIHTYNGSIRILDFSLGDLPRQIDNHPYSHRPFVTEFPNRRRGMRLTTSGDVVMIQWVTVTHKRIPFQIYKMSSKRETKESFRVQGLGDDDDAADWERVHSFEDEESLVWDLSVTLPTKGVSGIKKDSIYYCHTSNSSIREVATYEFPTHKISAYEIPKQAIKPIRHRGILIGEARWFVPCFGAGVRRSGHYTVFIW
ncbi:F-box protein At1g10110 isoform X2 [Arabidopsis lyrata subsp. lyrata]|nr:F-box protein At1g10110 isoform X2 [Arabidopsis lyrata subsp. lyrata]|eukprot:XP_020868563.1 F-box protein At1g10110 isoform X2 [Arabidopsis lyrata subsp. lyrata]